ncbi:MAG TPA: hypothetical protein VFQ53_08935 [Kofleriaceae bacterium]|nr:hypothetical protein [Kofleriaceae bacterium]
MRTLRAALWGIAFVAACGGKSAPTATPPSNQSATPVTTEPAPAPEPCAAKDCQGCIAASCQWDIDKHTCAKQCEPGAKNCLLVGAENIGADRAAEVCAGARQ